MLVIYWPRANVTLIGIILSFEENVIQCQSVDLEYSKEDLTWFQPGIHNPYLVILLIGFEVKLFKMAILISSFSYNSIPPPQDSHEHVPLKCHRC